MQMNAIVDMKLDDDNFNLIFAVSNPTPTPVKVPHSIPHLHWPLRHGIQLLKRETPLEGVKSDMFLIVNEGPALLH